MCNDFSHFSVAFTDANGDPPSAFLRRVIVLSISKKSLMSGVNLFRTPSDQHHLCQTTDCPTPEPTPCFCSDLKGPPCSRPGRVNENPTSRVEATSVPSRLPAHAQAGVNPLQCAPGKRGRAV